MEVRNVGRRKNRLPSVRQAPSVDQEERNYRAKTISLPVNLNLDGEEDKETIKIKRILELEGELVKVKSEQER